MNVNGGNKRTQANNNGNDNGNDSMAETLIEACDNLKKIKRDLNNEKLRITVNSVGKSENKGIEICGKIETGILNINDSVAIFPNNLKCKISQIMVDYIPCQTAIAGDNINISFYNNVTNLNNNNQSMVNVAMPTNYNCNHISVGAVICDIKQGIPDLCVDRFIAQVFWFVFYFFFCFFAHKTTHKTHKTHT